MVGRLIFSSKGYGFIEYEAQKVSIQSLFTLPGLSGFGQQDADECVDTFHGRDFQGRPLLVEFAKENRRREPNMDRSYVKANVGVSLHRDADNYNSCRLAAAVHLESNYL